MFTSYIKSLVINIVFGDIYSKSQYFHFFALTAILWYEYGKCNIFHELRNKKVLTYLNFKKFQGDITSTESEMYMSKIGWNFFIAATVLALEGVWIDNKRNP